MEGGRKMSDDDSADPGEELSTISYKAVGLGVPVVSHSGEQFGVVEHVLEVPELDVFDGIVVYTGTGLSAFHPKSDKLARAEMLRVGQRRGWLRFVDADRVAAITPAYVKCTFELPEVSNLPAPNGPPVLHPDMEREDRASMGMNSRYGPWFGRWFGRPHWTNK
jgi:hypothetical protein